ncbi:hypothetical protein NDU88_007783 [Pleurodeles waltl]|uniref:Uncharacterized protein n=1 Tax=Pleurodeles waltl TaxID=8319 RepID=A0AAV7NYY3_PLEWA|nr:hypothetical protein NDU88_007783 [Pleurodeles waltl]
MSVTSLVPRWDRLVKEKGRARIGNLVPTEQVVPRLLLVQAEPTPILMPRAQQQGMPRFTPMTGTQSDLTPEMNQSMGVTRPQNAGARAAPDAISLPITVSPAVPLLAQKKSITAEQGKMIKSHLICWQAKPIDEELQYAKYCSDEIELKQKKLKEKAMVMQIKAAQTGVQENFVQQIPQQQRTVMFQPQMRVDRIEIQTSSDDEKEPAPD